MINNASCIIRMNHAPTEHYKEDVGSRTTIRVICHMSTENVMVNAEGILSGDGAPEKVLFFGLNDNNHRWAKMNAHKLMKQFPDVDYYSLDKFGERNADIIFELETGKSKKNTNTWLSTGWYTFLVAIDMCEEIDVYGFVDENYCRSTGNLSIDDETMRTPTA
ncbi:alpha-N-acetylgalactosaminide alpha-2,6-sialyltransferase 5-like [Anneissia japonica]|uniref:alpha-N-acetylgalactosaminide alpha-2,6-sialyltransferase 5-like n=1 Tax=Anneissia japonica TaxID=1529436 RepID=UPI00142561E0|nr:alpha-N-acetylgalactosaminide alpha-2,6-sialyltransferase 5-like [Anneissia japonica]